MKKLWTRPRLTHNKIIIFSVLFAVLGVSLLSMGFAGSPVAQLAHPNGTFVRDSKGTVHLIDGGARRIVPVKEVRQSYDYPDSRVKTATDKDMALKAGPELKLKEGAVVKDDANKLYVIDWTNTDVTKQPITQKDLDSLGYKSNEVMKLKSSLLPKSVGSQRDSKLHPDGTFIRDSKGTVYFIENGVRLSVKSPLIRESYFISTEKVKQATDADMRLAEGAELGFRVGSLLRDSKSNVYAIDYVNGTPEKRFISTKTIRVELGFTDNEIVTVADNLLPAKTGSAFTMPSSKPVPKSTPTPNPTPNPTPTPTPSPKPTPTPPSPPSPTPPSPPNPTPSSAAIFNENLANMPLGKFTFSQAGYWLAANYYNPSRIQVVNDPLSKFGKVRQHQTLPGEFIGGDANGSRLRSEVFMPNVNGKQWSAHPGDDYYYGFRVLATQANSNFSITQFKGMNPDSNAYGGFLSITDKGGFLLRMGSAQVWSANQPSRDSVKNKWYDFVIHVKYNTVSSPSSGVVEVWWGEAGKPVKQNLLTGGQVYNGQTVFGNNEAAGSNKVMSKDIWIKQGIYGGGAVGTIYFSNTRIGPTFASVVPR